MNLQEGFRVRGLGFRGPAAARAKARGPTAQILRRPAAAEIPADEASEDHAYRFCYLWYQDEAIGLSKFWRSRSGKIKSWFRVYLNPEEPTFLRTYI